MPILLDINSGAHEKLDYSAFSLGSLKLRVCLTTLEEIFKLRKFDIKQLKFRFQGQNKELVKHLYNEIERWENLSINLTRVQLHDKDTMIVSDKGNMPIKEELFRICEEIRNKKIIQGMGNLIAEPFYPKDMTFEEIEKAMLNICKLFKGNPTHKQIFDVWKDYSWFKPKHLISILTKYPNINRNAILIALAYHEHITSRFR